MILRFGQVVEQKFQDQRAAKAPALDLEVGESHGQIAAPDILHADEAGVFHGLGEAVAFGSVRRGAAVLRAGLAQILLADRFVAGSPVPTAEEAALVAEEFHLVLQRLGQGVQSWSKALFSRKSGTT